jgi:hypothetical protein
MNDIEEQLRRYRPTDPPGDLRARVIEGARSQSSRVGELLPWVPAFAAAAAAVILAVLASNARADVARHVTSADRSADIAALTDALGGDELARVEAERLIAQADRDALSASPTETLIVDSVAGAHD